MTDRLTVREYMSTDIISLSPDADVLSAIYTLLNNDISGAPVIDATGELVGMLTERDCMKVALDAAYHQQSGGTVADFMVGNVEVVSAEDSIIDVIKKFYEGSYLRYPVVDGTGLVGIISRKDMMRAMGNYWKVSWDSARV